MFPVIKGLSFPPSRLRKPSVPNDNLPNNRYFVPQAGQVLLITDTPASSAQFLIHALLQSQLKREGEASRSCVLVSVDHDFAHISGIAARANLNLSQCLRDKNLMYIDALSQIPRPPAHLAPGILVCPPLTTSLRPLYDVIHRAFQDLPRTAAERVLILGDISTLEWIGVSSTEVTRFVRAIRALAAKNESGVVISYHSHSADLPIESDVLRDLVTTSDVHVEVRELSSGLSSAVSGEVAIHSGFAALDPHFVPIPRERAVQYRLTDGGVVWFERGTSAGVL